MKLAYESKVKGARSCDFRVEVDSSDFERGARTMCIDLRVGGVFLWGILYPHQARRLAKKLDEAADVAEAETARIRRERQLRAASKKRRGERL